MKSNQLPIFIQSKIKNGTAFIRYATRQKTIRSCKPPLGARNLHLMIVIGICGHPFKNLKQIIGFRGRKFYHFRFQKNHVPEKKRE